MKAEIKALFESAHALPAKDRILVLESMLDTLENSKPAMERLWVQESAERLAAFRHGEIVARQASAVFSQHRFMEAKATTVRFVEIAEIELEEAMHYYKNTTPVIAHHFLDEVIAATERIARYPTTWRTMGKGIHRCRPARFAYELLYTVDNGGILALAVARTPFLPLRWRDLLKWRDLTRNWPSPTRPR